MAGGKRSGTVAMHEFSRSRHIGAIAVDGGIRSQTFAGYPVEVCAVTAAPLPRIVEIEG